MALLPPALRPFDSLLDLLADVIARDIEQDAETATPATSAKGAGVNQLHDREQRQEAQLDADAISRASRAAIARR